MTKRVNEHELLDILSNEIRRRILEYIHDRVEASYTELLELTGVGSGTLNFHLKKLEGLIGHTPRGTYILTDLGKLAVGIILRIREELGGDGSIARVRHKLSKGVVFRRVLAFLVDALIFFVFTGAFVDPVLWGSIVETVNHLGAVFENHPWIFHLEHLVEARGAVFRLVEVYAHVFFAVYIFLTILEAYKGQTPGKYLLGIRVVKASGGRISLLESAIRNAGKVFLLPLDLLVGVIAYSRRGYIRFFDYYTEATVELVRASR